MIHSVNKNMEYAEWVTDKIDGFGVQIGYSSELEMVYVRFSLFTVIIDSVNDSMIKLRSIMDIDPIKWKKVSLFKEIKSFICGNIDSPFFHEKVNTYKELKNRINTFERIIRNMMMDEKYGIKSIGKKLESMLDDISDCPFDPLNCSVSYSTFRNIYIADAKYGNEEMRIIFENKLLFDWFDYYKSGDICFSEAFDPDDIFVDYDRIKVPRKDYPFTDDLMDLYHIKYSDIDLETIALLFYLRFKIMVELKKYLIESAIRLMDYPL